MLRLSLEEVLTLIKKRAKVSATIEDHSFSVEIEEYVPFICAALHHGGNLRDELRDCIALSKYGRWFEEDPHTGLFISSLPVRLVANDSRYEYDLNRSPEQCIYDVAWGKTVWRKPLSVEQKSRSLVKHAGFYQVVKQLMDVILEDYKSCIVYDIHSYNFKRRLSEGPPLFNVGSKQVPSQYRPYVKTWLEELAKIQVPGVENITEENKVFSGEGYFAKFIYENFSNVLVLPTEIKKIYVDELAGDEFPEIIAELREGLKTAIINHAHQFVKDETSSEIKKKHKLLSSSVDPELSEIDSRLFKLASKLELLDFVNPTNLEAARKAFFKEKYQRLPEFKYRPLPVDVVAVKRELYQLPIEKIKDINLQNLYREVIEDIAEQLDLLSYRGRKEFLYTSLRYFGEPDDRDVQNARYLLHCGDVGGSENNHKQFNSEHAVKYLKSAVSEYGFNCKVGPARDIPSSAVFNNSSMTLKVRKSAIFTETSLGSLAHHEIGIHMLTAVNAREQDLKLLRLGLPQNTTTQEGLAILSEYLSGNLTIDRLKILALRVLAVQAMIKGDSFSEVFSMLVDTLGAAADKAYYITARVFRGGGLTKDFLYLRGFREMFALYQAKKDLNCLVVGKTSLTYRKLLLELMVRGIVKPPTHIPLVFKQPVVNDEKLTYVVKNLN